MADKTLQLEIPVLLPEVEDERDQCVARLQEQLSQRKGVSQVHVDRQACAERSRSDGQAQLCIHYDPDLVALSQVQRWAEQAGAQVTERYRHERMRITDMDCGDCARSIEHILGRQDGVLDVSVNYAAEKMWVEYDTTVLDHQAIARRVQDIGYSVEEEEAPKGWIRENWQLVLSIASGIFLAAGFFGETFFGLSRPAAIGLYVLAYLAGGYDATRHGLHAARNLRFNIDFLMVVAAIGAAILGKWAEGALLLLLFSLGHALEHYAMDRARHAIEALGEITPKTARVQRDGRETEVPVEGLLRGDVVIVRPGERVPIDGEVIDGQSAVDQSPITGESVPVEKEPGDEVFAGTVNGESTLEIEVTKLAQDTTLSRVIQMVEEAQAQKSLTQQFTDRFTRVFVPAVLAGVVLVITVPPLIGLLPWQASFFRGMTILVAASPCALAIATPSAVLSGIAQAVPRKAQAEGLDDLPQAGELESVTGRGVRAALDDRVVRIGNLKLFEIADGQSVPRDIVDQVETLEAEGKTTMLVHDGERFLGIIGLADQPRDEARSTLERLRALGIKALIMLTGDNERVAATIADVVGLTDYKAGLLPEEKVTAIKDLLDEHGQVAMVGDGVNDAPALATSTVGIAMGASGTDVALETADVALMADDLSRLPFAVGLSRQSRRIIRQNLAISLGVIALLIPAALFGLAGIGLAIIFHEGSTLVVVANALRLLGYKGVS